MSDKRWKAVEREVMTYLGGRRIPITGRVRGDVPDGSHPWLVPEIKHTGQFPKKWREAHLQAVSAYIKLQVDDPGKDRLPIVIIHPHRAKIENCYVMLNLEDFRDWFVGNTE